MIAFFENWSFIYLDFMIVTIKMIIGRKNELIIDLFILDILKISDLI